jgi:hypothetical protein
MQLVLCCPLKLEETLDKEPGALQPYYIHHCFQTKLWAYS